MPTSSTILGGLIFLVAFKSFESLRKINLPIKARLPFCAREKNRFIFYQILKVFSMFQQKASLPARA